ncbi:hypothetical protein RP20_CCG014849 [Aedes albopictus]|nr:hypothetical protein RP20_CCG014849 [Aedes albopictus]
MRKYREKCEALKKQMEKNQQQLLKIAELKDLLVFANVEAKKAKLDPHAKHTFTTNDEIDMTEDQIEEVNMAFKSDVTFGLNLAIFFYGAQRLGEMSVKRLQLVEKVQQRVAARFGANNLSLINTLAHSTVINKGIAEKIVNLSNTNKYAEARSASRDVGQEAQSK